MQVYSVRDSLLCLTGTAEVPLGAMYMDQILTEDQLPIKLAGYGHCFRTEAGAGGMCVHLLPSVKSPSLDGLQCNLIMHMHVTFTKPLHCLQR